MAKQGHSPAACSPSETVEYNMKLATAYSALGLAIDSRVGDEIVLAKFGARAVNGTYYDKKFLKQLAMVGDHRSSKVIANFVKHRAYQIAIYDLYVAEDDSDDIVKGAFIDSFGDPLTSGNGEARDALKVVAEYRNSLVLQNFVAGESAYNTTIRGDLPGRPKALTDSWSKATLEGANHNASTTPSVYEWGGNGMDSLQYSEEAGESAARDDWNGMHGKPREASGYVCFLLSVLVY